MRGKAVAGIVVLCLGLWISSAGTAEAGDMAAPLPMLQMNPLFLRYMGFTASDALQPASQRHRVSIQEHYANIYLVDHISNTPAWAPSRYLIDMELSVTDVTLRTSLGKLGLHLDLPVLRPLAGIGDGFVNGFHRIFHYPSGGREYRPLNNYAYTLQGGWDSHPRWELGNVSAGLSYPLWRSERNAVAVRAGVKAPTASRQRGWGSGTWDTGIGLVDSFRRGAWFAHAEGWYFRPLGSDYVGYLKNRPYVRGSLAVGVTGRFFKPVSDRRFSFVVQGQGGISPYRGGSGLITATDHISWLVTEQNPWLVAAGLRWQDSHQRDWLFSLTENITQHSTQDISFDLGCSFL